MIGNPIRWNDPTSWPWVFYVWIAFALAGLAKPAWNWFRRTRAASWPVADGRIESVEISKPGFSFTAKRGHYLTTLSYSFYVAGTLHSGCYRRDFPTEDEAEEFARDLQNKTITVHCNATNPARSALLEPDIDTLLQNRSPAPPLMPFQSVKPVPDWLKPFLWVFVSLSCIGLVVSLWVHLGALIGRRVAPEAFFWILHVGIFVVWFPAVFVAQRLVGNLNRRDFWKNILKNSPDWMRYMVYFFFGYAMVNFLFFLSKAPSGDVGGNPSAIMWRGFSGHWMAFYSAALAILYSAARSKDTGLHCPNGHLMSHGTIYCTHCGQASVRRS